MEKEWYVAKDSKRLGPFSEAVIRDMITKGNISSTTKVWNNEMANWQEAIIPFEKFFPEGAKKVDLGDIARGVGDSSVKVAKAGQKLFSRIGDIADRVGNIAGESVIYDQNLPTQGNDPAIFLRDLYFGGRKNIGSSLTQLGTMGGLIMSALFSFSYMAPILYFSLSSWQFLPYSKAELVRITLRQKLRWEKLLPILIGWFITMVAGIIICFLWVWLFAKIDNFLGTAEDGVLNNTLKFLASLSFWVFLAFYVSANLSASKKIARLTEYSRSCVILDYGFPNKTRLLMGVSDAPVEKQMEGVLSLCEAISKANFAPWEGMGAHRNFGIRTFVASTFRKII
jgi:hypothetical protein